MLQVAVFVVEPKNTIEADFEDRCMSTNTNERPVAWVDFAKNAAKLRRLIAPSEIRGLILTLDETQEAEEIREKAKVFGFVETKNRRNMRMFFENGAGGLRVSDMAVALGGNVISLSRDDLLGDQWTVNLSNRAPSLTVPEDKAAKNIAPNPKEIEAIGLNMRGEEVVRDGSGRFYRKLNLDTGESQFIHEQEGDKPSLFLRASKPEDLEAIASALVMMASKGTLHQADFNRVISAAMEAGPHGQLGLPKSDVVELVRGHMLREITAIAVDEEASRERFVSALRISASSAFVLSRYSEPGSLLSPSPALSSFLRRQSRGMSAVDFRGSDDVKVAMPRIFRDNAMFQFNDLAGVPEDGLTGYAMNVIARREADGRSILRIPARADSPEIQRMRNEIGMNYALEGVAEIAAAVADGLQDGNVSTLFFIGERRPEALEALPVAAMRTYQVQTNEELISLERDIFRARAKIRDWHKGVESEMSDKKDNREENIRQRPFQSLSRIKEPFTMIPVSLEGATRKAQDRVRRDTEELGGMDAVVASAVGSSIDELGEKYTAEQAEALAMYMNARDRGRAILIADQTGVGKGRTLAGIAYTHLRSGPNKKVLYFTESGAINAPDVYRDLRDVGATKEITPLFLTTGSEVTDTKIDPITNLPYEVKLSSQSPAKRKAIVNSQRWPDDCRMIITTYSQFRGAEESADFTWLEHALDEDTLIILDEAHNALNEKSMQGKAIRRALESVRKDGDWSNVVFGTATPMRDPSGMSLYRPLLPAGAAEGLLGTLLDNIKSGGEVAQETLASVFAADGVMRRLDHDLSSIEFRVALPDDARMLKYHNIMNQFSPVVELMIEASGQVSEHLGRRQAQDYNAARARGMSPQAARAQSNELNQYSTALGSPLANLARFTMNAIKIDQVVDEALAEIQEGRKPLITFHSTNSALFDEMSRDDNGQPSEDVMANANNLTLRDQIHRIHNNMYRIKIDGETRDARETYTNVRETAQMITDMINQLPADLPASPVDALVERLEMHGINVGEISGRNLAYRNNRIVRRSPEERNKKSVIDRFNGGELDVLVYNSAGATGGSYHASPHFADQRPRTMIELEAPTDVIKYVQSQGRGNRYGQVAKPRVKSVMTGLTPEMRILQQRNKKLRSLGASVDGNRSHPMLLDDVPDLLNRVGDEATRNVLISMPSMARRLGFPELAEEIVAARMDDNNDSGSGAGMAGAESIANKVLTRSIMLSAAEQDDLVQRIRMEFDALIEELESRNANPLRPKELEGQIEIKATTIYSGLETADDDLDTSGFLSPLYISTGIHHFNEDAWNGDKLVTAIEATRRLYGSEGFAPYAGRIRQNLPSIMRPFLPEGLDMEEALANPGNAGTRFQARHNRFTTQEWLLDNMRPGVGIRFPTADDKHGLVTSTIVGLVPPANPDHYEIASAYKVKLISPGMSKPETIALSRLMQLDQTKIFFRPGLSENIDESYLDEFNRESVMTRRLPVQILHGNLLQALNESAKHDLGTVCLYRDMDGTVHRGIVVQKSKLDLDKLPVAIPNGVVARELGYAFLADDEVSKLQGAVRFWGSMDPSKPIPTDKQDAEIYISLTRNSAAIELLPLRKSTEEWYRSRPGLYEALHNKPMPESKDVPARALRRGNNTSHNVRFKLEDDADRNRLLRILDMLDDASLLVDSPFRAKVNDIQVNLERILGNSNFFGATEAPEVEEDEISEDQNVEAMVDHEEAQLAEDIENTTWN